MRALYPNSIFKSTRVDEHFADEAAALSEFPIVYSIEDGRITARGFEVEGETLLYRGWILTPTEYDELNTVVLKAGGELLVSPEQYRRTQFGNGWLSHMEGITPKTVILPYNVSDEEIMEQAGLLGASQFVLKGASKSAKQDWGNAMFANDISQLPRILNGFRGYVTASEENTILLREYEEWKLDELRLWWVDGKLAYTGLHPESIRDLETEGLDEFLPVLEPRVASLDCPVLTTDLAQSHDGEWRVVEIGNGQVTQPRTTFAEVVKGTSLGGLYRS